MLEFETAAARREAQRAANAKKGNPSEAVAEERVLLKGAEFKIDGETFWVHEPADSAKLMAAAMITTYHEARDDATKGRAIGALIDFLGACLAYDQYQAFYAICVDPRRGLDSDQIAELADHIVSKVGGVRPTDEPSGSSSSRAQAGQNSKANGSSAARKRPARSTSR